MGPPRVLIIGCGIAGPVIALLLKRKGYHPVIYEKVRQLGDAGASLALQPNGMKVLGLLGLDEEVYEDRQVVTGVRDLKASGDLLGGTDLPATYRKKYGHMGVGLKRTELSLMLKERTIEEGIDIREGCTLESIEEEKDQVFAHFENGLCAKGSFLIGCDGVRAASRLFVVAANGGKDEDVPEYTGLTQTACFAPTPASIKQPYIRNWYGDAMHVIAYSVDTKTTSLAITRREGQEHPETWKLCNTEERDQQKAALLPLLRGWDPAVRELVKSATRVTKFGLFDRGELKPEYWHTGRCILVGDAAHPTSPHLGQGANQALEDSYHLWKALPDLKVEPGEVIDTKTPLQTPKLSSIFRTFAGKRAPRTAELVKGARAVGERRVVSGGTEKIAQRDALMADSWKDKKAVAARYDALLQEPF